MGGGHPGAAGHRDGSAGAVSMITLPWPPSVNRYWRSVNGRVLIAAAGRQYRMGVELVAAIKNFKRHGDANVVVRINAWFPDKRRRDIDNVLKAPLDALTSARVWNDDSQIVYLSIRRAGIDRAHPRLEIAIEEAA